METTNTVIESPPEESITKEQEYDPGFPLGPNGPSQKEIDALKAKFTPSPVYAIFLGGDMDVKVVLIRTINRGEFSIIRAKQVDLVGLEDYITQNYAIWPSKDIITQWTEVFAGIPTSIMESVFQYSGFINQVQGIKL